MLNARELYYQFVVHRIHYNKKQCSSTCDAISRHVESTKKTFTLTMYKFLSLKSNGASAHLLLPPALLLPVLLPALPPAFTITYGMCNSCPSRCTLFPRGRAYLPLFTHATSLPLIDEYLAQKPPKTTACVTDHFFLTLSRRAAFPALDHASAIAARAAILMGFIYRQTPPIKQLRTSEGAQPRRRNEGGGGRNNTH